MGISDASKKIKNPNKLLILKAKTRIRLRKIIILVNSFSRSFLIIVILLAIIIKEVIHSVRSIKLKDIRSIKMREL